MRVVLFDSPQYFPWSDESREALADLTRRFHGITDTEFWSAFEQAIDHLYDYGELYWDDLESYVQSETDELAALMSEWV